MTEILYEELSFEIIGLAMEVHQKLGHGFVEKIYERALMILLDRKDIDARNQVPVNVRFEGEIIGNYKTDILIEDKIILELKAKKEITDGHKTQVINYLKASGIKLGIIINFGSKSLEFERLITTN